MYGYAGQGLMRAAEVAAGTDNEKGGMPMLTHGGCEAAANVRQATETLVRALYGADTGALAFPEVAELERDAYGRVMVFVRVREPSGREEALLLVFTAVEPDGTFRASPKCVMRVRENAFYAGLEHHRVRNSWNCPIDSVPVF
jgi:hypothetical protein